jgi:hypothetical protein
MEVSSVSGIPRVVAISCLRLCVADDGRSISFVVAAVEDVDVDEDAAADSPVEYPEASVKTSCAWPM